ncbi:MAG: hypothetical protein Q7T82_13835 [Armatimonadota bacterium]|nr:hypothetical protein [Armatimonadota bacterium]
MIETLNRKMVPILIGMVLLTSASPLRADGPLGQSGQADGLFGALGSLYVADAQPSENVPSKPEFETLQGSGTPAGYVLSHGNVIARSESVTVGGMKQTRGVDYYMDYRGGSLMFSRPIKETEAVRVSYRYAAGDTGERTVLSVPGLALANTRNLSLDFTYAYRAAGASGQTPDIATYGFNSTVKLGLASSLNSMIYISNPQKSAMRFSDLSPLSRLTAGAQQGTADQLMSQNADIGLGGAKLRIGYQDVGLNFNGFSALRDSRAASEDVLKQLEKEKGLKRMSLGLQFGSGSGLAAVSSPNGLFWNTIQDKTGEFYSRGFNFDSKSFGFFADMRGSDKGFARLKDLTDAEKTAMSLSIRRQFNPDATAQQVTDKDKEQLLKQAGLDRGSYGLRFGSGPTASWMQMLRISGQGGGIERDSFRFAGKNFNLSGFKQSIDDSFTRLADMTEVEKQQFGNERGMDRLNLAGDVKLGGGMQATMAFSKVSDDNGGLTRQSLGFKGKTFDVKANFLNIDQGFTRIADLVDPDKAKLVTEQGFKQMDLSGAFALGKKISLKSFLYNAHNEARGLDRKQLRNEITYALNKDTKLGLLSDQFSFTSETGNVDTYWHKLLTFEHRLGNGIYVTGSDDTLEARKESAEAQLITRRTMHLETDKTKKLFGFADRKLFDLDNGKFENTLDVNLQYSLSKSLSMKARHLDIDRGEEPSSASDIYNAQWNLRNGLSLTADLTQRATNNEQDLTARKLMLQGPVFKRFGWFRNGKLAAGVSRESLNGDVSKSSAAAKFESDAFGGNLMLEYSGQEASNAQLPSLRTYKFVSNRDPKSWLHFDALYKRRDDGPTNPYLVRAYNLDAKLFGGTTLNYNYFTYKEAADGKTTPVGGALLRLTSTVGNGYKLIADYRKDEDFKEMKVVSPLTIGVSGKLSYGADFEVSLGRSLAGTAAGALTGRTIRFKYDHQVSADHYLNFEAAVTKWNSTNPGIQAKDDIEARIDYKANLDFLSH